MNTGQLRTVCVEMQSAGVVLGEAFSGRRGGAGPAEGQTVIIDGHYLNVPVSSGYVQDSAYRIVSSENGHELYKGARALCAVAFPPHPRYYRLNTPSGIPLKKIALIHGRDCLASTVYQNCLCFNTPLRCRFCGIEFSLQQGQTVDKKAPLDLALAAEKGCLLDRVTHVTLTSGVYPSARQAQEHLCACIKEIKNRVALDIHVQVCPAGSSMALIERLRAAGADTIGIHAETCSLRILEQIAPFKAQIGFETYWQWWAEAVAVFGSNQVSSFLIAGLGEDVVQMADFAESLCSMGVFPYILPHRPIPGSDLEQLRPPDPDVMTRLYETTAAHLITYGLSSADSKAGCVRCGACSSLALFE